MTDSNHDLFRSDKVPRGQILTSCAAFDSIRETVRGEQCTMVYAGVLRRGSFGATCDELERTLNLSHQSCSARLNDLMRFGQIEVTDRKRPTRTGRGAYVYIVQEAGR